MPNPVEILLNQVGIPAEEVSKIMSLPEEEQATFDPAPYTEKVRANYRTQFKNDPEFFDDTTLENLPSDIKKKVESNQYGRAINVVKSNLLKAVGLTERDFEELGEDGKKIDVFAPAFIKKVTEGKVSDKQLQAELIEARKKIESFEGFEDKIKTQYETQANQTVAGAIFNYNVVAELSAIPGLKISALDVSKTANDILQSKYSFERVGDTVELRQKSNPSMKVLKGNTSQELTLKEALTEIATERGWIETKTQTQQGSGTIKVEPNSNGLKMVVAPHLQDKLSKKIAEESKS